MKEQIFIPFEDFNTIGGPTTFMSNLRLYLDDVNYSYINNYKNAKVIFFPVSYKIEDLKYIKNCGGKVIQRLDGIYYPSKHLDAYTEKNRDIKNIYFNYADFVIFQSEYSKNQCFSMFGEKREDQYTLIINGVNKKVFCPEHAKKELPAEFKLVTTGNFRNLDMLEPVVKALDLLQGKVKFELTVVGPITNSSLDFFLERSYINYVGPKDMQSLANILRASDLFIYSHLNPPCPNSVIEAISCGLPVVGFNSGSMAELLYFSPELLADVSEDIFQKYEDFDSVKLAEKIMLALNNYQFYRNKSLEYSYLYSFEECGQKYVEVFNRIKSNDSYFSRIHNTVANLVRRKIWRK